MIPLLVAAMAGEPAWVDLAPWRTYVVLEDVSATRDWFVVDLVPKFDKRCEIGVSVDDAKSPPVVWCGPPQIGDGQRADVPRDKSAALKRAEKALEKLTGEKMHVEFDWLGTLRQVSFRQIIVTRQNDNPMAAEALSVRATWSVHANGTVDEGAVTPSVSRGPLCMPGVHVRCDTSPGLLPYEPEVGWDGMLYDPQWLQHQPEGPVARLLREAVTATATGRWAPVAARDTGGTVLPAGLHAGLAVDLVVGVMGETEERRITLDLPLNEAAFRTVRARIPIAETALQVEVEARLPTNTIDLRVFGPHGEAASGRFAIQCNLVTDGARALIDGPCTTDSVGRYLYARDPSGTELARVHLAESLEPLLVPSIGPALR